MIRGALSLALVLAFAIVGTTEGYAKPEASLHSNKALRFQLAVAPTLQPSKPAGESQAVLAFAGPGGLRASITSFESANRAAFRKDRNASFFAAIERGLATHQPRYKRLSRNSSRIERVPTLDLSFSRKGASGALEVVSMRFLFRYRFTVVATAIAPAASGKRVQRLARSFSQGLLPLASP
jgi:hypothetical protein